MRAQVVLIPETCIIEPSRIVDPSSYLFLDVPMYIFFSHCALIKMTGFFYSTALDPFHFVHSSRGNSYLASRSSRISKEKKERTLLITDRNR